MKKTLYSLLVTCYLFLVTSPTPAHAATDLGPGPSGVLQLQQIFIRLINISAYLAFFGVTAMLAWAGIKFITSGGEAKALQETWQIVTWTLASIIFLALGWLILNLVEIFTGVPVASSFCIGFPGAPTNCP